MCLLTHRSHDTPRPCSSGLLPNRTDQRRRHGSRLARTQESEGLPHSRTQPAPRQEEGAARFAEVGVGALQTRPGASSEVGDPDDRLAREALVRPELVTARLLVHAYRSREYGVGVFMGARELAELLTPRSLWTGDEFAVDDVTNVAAMS
jgi:hypothetical protein